jgi:iron complex transport system ATP-binding protein
MILRGRDLTVRYRGLPRPALEAVDLSLAPGELLGVVGPNGSGKTTLLRALLGLVPLERGQVELDGRPLAAWRPRELAQVVGVVPQREAHLYTLRVRETVALGRYAWLGPLEAEREADRRAVAEAMARCDVLDLAERRTDTLSGGEWQRVRIARALAQEPRALLLDEPTASLDVRHEMEVFELIRRLAEQGMAVLVITHHLNLAARFASGLLLLHCGRLAAAGPPAAVLEPALLAQVFEWPVAVSRRDGGALQVIPLRAGEGERGEP